LAQLLICKKHSESSRNGVLIVLSLGFITNYFREKKTTTGDSSNQQEKFLKMDLGLKLERPVEPFPTRQAEVRQLFDLESFLTQFPRQEFKKDQLIYKESSLTETVYFVEKGSIVLGCHSESGEDVITSLLFANQMFGEQGLLGLRERQEFAQSKQKTTVVVVPLHQLRKVMLENGSLGIEVNRLILKKFNIMQDKWKSQIVDYARTRVIDFILYLVENNGRRVGYEWIIDQFFPHREIAGIIGSSRQTVTVTLNELRQKNIIYFDRKRLIVRDIDKLKEEKC